MKKEEILVYLKEKFPEAIEQLQVESEEAIVKVSSDRLLFVALFVKQDTSLAFDTLMNLAGVDYSDRIEIIYHLFSLKHRHKLTLKVFLQKERPVVASVTPVWAGANWHEREIFDLFGVEFSGHPNLKRILLPDEWPLVYPLRKDFSFETYNQKTK